MITGKLMMWHFVLAVKAVLVRCTTIMLAIKPITQTVSGRNQILLRISGTVLAIRNTIVLAIKPIAKTLISNFAQANFLVRCISHAYTMHLMHVGLWHKMIRNYFL